MDDKKTNEVSAINMEDFLAQEELKLSNDLSRVKERKEASKLLTAKVIVLSVCVCLSGILTSAYALGSEYDREKGRRYEEAQMLQERGMYLDAIDVYEKLYGYKDSKANITTCQNDLKDAEKKLTYDNAVKRYNDKDYLAAATLFKKVSDYKDAGDKAKEAYYKYGQDLVVKADYANAYTAFVNASDYSDASVLAAKYKIASSNIGTLVKVGKIEQDGKTDNGADDISWYIIAKSDTQAILLSQYALALMPFDESGKAVSYEQSTIRKYLNDTFYNSVFTDEEKARIVSTKITQENSESDNNVFLLTSEMYTQYITTSTMKTVKATVAVMPNSTYSARSTYWWTSSVSGDKALSVSTSGAVYASSANMNCGVRPVICIDFTK